MGSHGCQFGWSYKGEISCVKEQNHPLVPVIGKLKSFSFSSVISSFSYKISCKFIKHNWLFNEAIVGLNNVRQKFTPLS